MSVPRISRHWHIVSLANPGQRFHIFNFSTLELSNSRILSSQAVHCLVCITICIFVLFCGPNPQIGKTSSMDSLPVTFIRCCVINSLRSTLCDILHELRTIFKCSVCGRHWTRPLAYLLACSCTHESGMLVEHKWFRTNFLCTARSINKHYHSGYDSKY